MKNIRKILALLLAAIMVLSLCACSKQQENVPDNKSESSGLYTSTDAEGNTVVVNPYNAAASNFSVDKDGNILNSKGEIFIAAENTLPYVPVTGVNAVCTKTFPVDLGVSAAGQAQPEGVDIQVTIAPANATCRAIMVESDNTDVAQVAIAGYNIAPGSDSVTVKVTMVGAGTANIRIKSSAAEGEELAATIPVSVTVNGSAQPSDPGTPAEPETPANGADTPGTGTAGAPGTTGTPGTAGTTNLGTGRTGYIVADSGLNMRENPSTSSNVITAIAYGTAVTIYGDAENGWYRVSYGGQTGYISASYVSFTVPTAAPSTESAGTTTPSDDDPYAGGSDGDEEDGGTGGIIIVH